jgi:hypothetical protein
MIVRKEPSPGESVLQAGGGTGGEDTGRAWPPREPGRRANLAAARAPGWRRADSDRVCLLLLLVRSCVSGGMRIVEDMCYVIRQARACGYRVPYVCVKF